MAEEKVKAVVRRLGALPAVHLAQWGKSVGTVGQIWVEEAEDGQWLTKVTRSPLWGEGRTMGMLLRLATPEDHECFQDNEKMAAALEKKAQAEVHRLNLPLKILGGEFDLGRRSLRLFFTTEQKADFRGFLRRLESEFKVRIKLVQLGPRDEAKVAGGIGPCGRPLCCQTFLPRLRHIPLDMAFHQGLSFSPGRLTGLCGRLVCCLAYEHEQYCTALKNFPKVGERIEVEGRQGEVTGVNIFRETIAIQWADGTKGELSWPKAR